MWGDPAHRQAMALIWPLWHGNENVRDRRRAMRDLVRLADAGYAPAMFAAGTGYFDGQGVRRSFATAFQYFLRAAELGYPSAEGTVGNFYIMARPKHEVCALNPEEAARWHRRGAEHGNPGAQYNLAFSLWTARGVARDPGETYLWASMAVRCSRPRIRPAEVLRDEAATILGPDDLVAADGRIAQLSTDLPRPWSEHFDYWKGLAEQAGVIDSTEKG